MKEAAKADWVLGNDLDGVVEEEEEMAAETAVIVVLSLVGGITEGSLVKLQVEVKILRFGIFPENAHRFVE